MNLLFQAVDRDEEESKVVSIVFGRLAVKWQNKILELFLVDTLNFVSLIEFLKTKDKQDEYKGLASMR